jgi:hypothetical protein
MDYKSKYLKYKYKYIELLNQHNQYNKVNQFGGAHTTVPDKNPNTYSFLFMPLIYYSIDNTSVRLLDRFNEIVEECIRNCKSFEIATVKKDNLIPFNNFEEFIGYLRQKINENSGIVDIEGINLIKDNDHHINGKLQIDITGYSDPKSPLRDVFSCIVQVLIPAHAGEKFVYLK